MQKHQVYTDSLRAAQKVCQLIEQWLLKNDSSWQKCYLSEAIVLFVIERSGYLSWINFLLNALPFSIEKSGDLELLQALLREGASITDEFSKDDIDTVNDMMHSIMEEKNVPPIHNLRDMVQVYAQYFQKQAQVSNIVNISFFLSDTTFSEKHGVIALAIILQNIQCRSELALKFNETELSSRAFFTLVAALQNGNWLLRELDLFNSKIDDEGATILAQLLTSGRCLPGFFLNLLENRIGDEGAIAFAHALESGLCPQSLELNFYNNYIEEDGAMALANALKSGQCPSQLRLELSDVSENEAFQALYEEAWSIYYNHHRHVFLACITLQQGHRQSPSPISQLPQEILKEIYRAIGSSVTEDIPARLLELSAKAFLPCFAEKCLEQSLQTIQGLKEELTAALEAGNVTERANNIKHSIINFLDNELGGLEKGAFKKSPITALLCKFHLLNENKVKCNPNNIESFQLTEYQVKRLKQS